MPREQIIPMTLALIDSDPKQNTPVHGVAWNSPGLHVGWMPSGDFQEGHVQLCIEADQRYIETAIQSTNEAVGEGSPIKVWSSNMSRAEMNKLIRTLRNARDKAFGRDE